jgi:hypothetical protein
MKKLFALIIGLLYLNNTNAQNTNELPQTGIKVAYMGSLIYPGFKVGIERPSKVIQLEKGSRTILKERYWTLNIGFYHHETFHTNLYLLAERQLRRQYANGLFFEFAPGVGYSRTFLGGTTYQVSDNGTVSTKTLAGYNYLMLSLSGGVGYDFSKKTETPVKAYLKPSLFFLTPSNSFIYVRPTVELGIIYSPKSFLRATPSVKIKKK